MLVLARDGTVAYANAAALELLGRSAEVVMGRPFGIPAGNGGPNEIEMLREGEECVAAVHTSSLRWNEEPATLVTLRDVTDRRRAERALLEASRTLAAVIGSAPVGIIRLDPDGRVLSWNPAAERMLGWTEGELLGQPCPLPAVLELGDEREIRARCADGALLDVALSTAPVLAEDGAVAAIVAVISDITERRRREEVVRHLASHDPLTGLLNRRAFEEMLERVTGRARRTVGRAKGAVLMVDLDFFKAVNDTAGHLAGDQLLIGVARAIESALRPGEVVGRLGGDELAVILTDGGAPGARAVAERLRTAVAAVSLPVSGRRLSSTATVGGSIIDGRLDAAEVLAVADFALNSAKQSGRNRTLVYAQAERKALELAETSRRANALRHALECDGFAIEHQPLLAIDDGEVLGVEALIRLSGPDGLEPPESFLPLADGMGLMAEIDLWMARHAIAALEDPDHPPIWVNLSRAALGHDALLALVLAAAAEQSLDGRLGFEVSEDSLLSDLMRMRPWIERLRAAGCRFALDDFGARSSSFASLRELPISVVKIDRYFVRDVVDDLGSRSVVRAIVNVCATLGHAVVAEGVEDEATRAAVAELGVDAAQGFLFADAFTCR